MGDTYTVAVAWARIAILLLLLGRAAQLDIRSRRVPNTYWYRFAPFVMSLWAIELIIRDGGPEIFLTMVGVVALASISFIGRPTFKDLLRGSKSDLLVTTWYVVGVAGVLWGASEHLVIQLQDIGLVANDCWLDCPSEETVALAHLWGEVMLVGVVILLFDLAWRFRLLHGGADVKGMMVVAMLLPSWWQFNPVYSSTGLTILPPAFSLLIWGGVAMLFLPPTLFFINISRPDSRNFRMAWHALRIPLDEIAGKHLWLLDEVEERADGSCLVKTRMRPKRKTPTQEEVEEQLEQLRELGEVKAWVTHKYPFMLFLFVGVLPLLLFGDRKSVV